MNTSKTNKRKGLEGLYQALLDKYITAILDEHTDPRVLKEAREFLKDNCINIDNLGEALPKTEPIMIDLETLGYAANQD